MSRDPDTASARRRLGRRAGALFCLAALGLLAACEPAPEPEPPAPEPEAAERLELREIGFADLAGWRDDRLAEALPAFRRSCVRLAPVPDDRALGTPPLPMRAGDWQGACAALAALPDGDDGAARTYFETWFVPFRVGDGQDEEGLITGYFEAELHGDTAPSATFATPLYARPPDLVSVDLGRFDDELTGRTLAGRVEDGRLVPYPDRAAIEAGLLAGQGLELVWVDDPVDAFLLQVQGSGRVILPDGSVKRLGFAGHNGLPYRSIGRALIDRGDLRAHEASWQGIRDWLARNPGAQAELFAVNPRFVFFRALGGQDGPIGAEGVALTPGRSLAVDRRYIPLRLPLWLETTWPNDVDRPLNRLMVAQDTGGAITGPVRGDFFWGSGDAALAEAGRMRQRGGYALLLPLPAAERVRAAASGS